MLSVEKLKCPRCERQVLKKVLQFTGGKCSNCGYTLVSSISNFVVQKVPVPKQ